nr:hypothetical protein [uncultured Nocardioides sp.]
MGPGGVDPRAAAGARLWMMTALGVLTLGVVVLLLADIRTSVTEARVLRAGIVCEAATATDCLAQEPVVLGPYNDALRTRMVYAHVRNVDAEPGDSDLVDVLPAHFDDVADLGERAVAHRVEGRVVALSGTADGERIPLGLTGIHGVLVDVSFVLVLVGLVLRAYGTVRASRRAGLGWSDRQPYNLAVRRRPSDLVMLAGCVLGTVTFFLATFDVRVWVAAAVVVLASWWWSPLERRMRGVGRHAA